MQGADTLNAVCVIWGLSANVQILTVWSKGRLWYRICYRVEKIDQIGSWECYCLFSTKDSWAQWLILIWWQITLVNSVDFHSQSKTEILASPYPQQFLIIADQDCQNIPKLNFHSKRLNQKHTNCHLLSRRQ